MSGFFITPGRPQSKTPILSKNVDQKSIETVFLNIEYFWLFIILNN